MTSDFAQVRLRIWELEGRILARRQLARQAPERAWHLDYVMAYGDEMRRLQAQIQGAELGRHNQSSRQPKGVP